MAGCCYEVKGSHGAALDGSTTIRGNVGETAISGSCGAPLADLGESRSLSLCWLPRRSAVATLVIAAESLFALCCDGPSYSGGGSLMCGVVAPERSLSSTSSYPGGEYIGASSALFGSGLDAAVSMRGLRVLETERDLVYTGEGRSLSALRMEAWLAARWWKLERVEVAAILAASESRPTLSLSVLFARMRVPSWRATPRSP